MFTIEQLNKSIESITRAQARATKEIGKVLLMALWFANTQKDAGAANALLNCLRKSTKQQGIIALLEAHGNLAFTEIGKKKSEFQFFDAKHDAKSWEANIKELRAICDNWESFKPAKEEQELDVQAAIERLIAKVDSAKKNNKPVAHAELMGLINSALATYTAALTDKAIA